MKINFLNKDAEGLSNTLAIIYNDGADCDYTDILLSLLDEKWHISEKDIVSILELIKDPKSIDKLYSVATDVPDYDEIRALTKNA